MGTDLESQAWDGRAPGNLPHWRRLATDRFLQLAAARQPAKEAVRCDGRSVTYEEFDAMANRAANGLLAMGARPGDVIGVVADNDPEVFALLYGIARAGLTLLPMNPKYTAAEIQYQVEEAGARFVVAPKSVTVADVLARGHDAEPDVVWDENSFFQRRFTSGTTGKPKMLATTQRAIATMHQATARELLYSETDVALVMAPVAHAAFHIAAATILVGGTVVLERGFDARSMWEICDRNQITHTYLAPTMFALSMDSPGSGDSIKAFLSMSSIFPLALKERVWARFPNADLYDCYGSTEVGLATLLRPTDPRDKQATVGRVAFGYEMRVLDADGKDLPPDEVGEIYVRGPGMSFGYVGSQPMRPGQARDGFVSAGDLGSLDADGYLTVADRRDDLIVSGGLNVYPTEVEDVVLRAHGVTEVAVVGVPDETWGHLVVAVVIGGAGSEDLDRHCREHLARYKVPRRYVFRDELPRNLNGKVLRRSLRAELAASARQQSRGGSD